MTTVSLGLEDSGHWTREEPGYGKRVRAQYGAYF